MTPPKPRGVSEGAKTGALEPEERTRAAQLRCAEWLAGCVRLGWSKDSLDALEDMWWKLHDGRGNPVPVALEARTPDPRYRALLKAARRVESELGRYAWTRQVDAGIVALRDALADLKEVEDD